LRDPKLPTVEASALAWLSVEQMRAVDRGAISIGLSLVRMMENAGASLASLARQLLGGDLAGRRVVVLCGPGGNGGGGLVAARRLGSGGAAVDVRLGVAPEALAAVPREQYELLRRSGVEVRRDLSQGLRAPDLVIDALLGYSQAGAPRGGIAELAAATAGLAVLALDVPTGLELESGAGFEPAVRAGATMTLALPKSGLRSEAGLERTGELYLADISVPAPVYDQLGIRYRSPFTRGPIVGVRGLPGSQPT
jgi:NAD(P)H-hydrate epimerase